MLEIKHKLKKSKFKAPSVAKIILTAVGLAGLVTIAVIAPNSLQMLKLFGLGKRQYKPRSVYGTYKRMQKERWIEVEKINNKIIIKTTVNGKKKFLDYQFEEMRIKRPEKWDGKWRVVGFDIPEKIKKARNALRNKLTELGFWQIQKSLFVLPYDCRKEINFIADFFQVQDYILLIEAATITNEDYLKDKFKLN